MKKVVETSVTFKNENKECRILGTIFIIDDNASKSMSISEKQIEVNLELVDNGVLMNINNKYFVINEDNISSILTKLKNEILFDNRGRIIIDSELEKCKTIFIEGAMIYSSMVSSILEQIGRLYGKYLCNNIHIKSNFI